MADSTILSFTLATLPEALPPSTPDGDGPATGNMTGNRSGNTNPFVTVFESIFTEGTDRAPQAAAPADPPFPAGIDPGTDPELSAILAALPDKLAQTAAALFDEDGADRGLLIEGLTQLLDQDPFFGTSDHFLPASGKDPRAAGLGFPFQGEGEFIGVASGQPVISGAPQPVVTTDDSDAAVAATSPSVDPRPLPPSQVDPRPVPVLLPDPRLDPQPVPPLAGPGQPGGAIPAPSDSDAAAPMETVDADPRTGPAMAGPGRADKDPRVATGIASAVLGGLAAANPPSEPRPLPRSTGSGHPDKSVSPNPAGATAEPRPIPPAATSEPRPVPVLPGADGLGRDPQHAGSSQQVDPRPVPAAAATDPGPAPRPSDGLTPPAAGQQTAAAGVRPDVLASSPANVAAGQIGALAPVHGAPFASSTPEIRVNFRASASPNQPNNTATGQAGQTTPVGGMAPPLQTQVTPHRNDGAASQAAAGQNPGAGQNPPQIPEASGQAVQAAATAAPPPARPRPRAGLTEGDPSPLRAAAGDAPPAQRATAPDASTRPPDPANAFTTATSPDPGRTAAQPANAHPANTVQANTVQASVVQASAVQASVVQPSAIQASAAQAAKDSAVPDEGSSAFLAAVEPGQTGSAASPAPGQATTTRGDLPRHVAHQMAMALQQPRDHPIELRLNPEELGRVRLMMAQGDGTITVSIQAERGETLDLMRRHIALLENEFREIGYANIQFSFGTPDQAPQDPETGPGADDTRPMASGQTEPDETPALSTAASAPRSVSDGLDLRL